MIERHSHLRGPDRFGARGLRAKDKTMKRFLIERDIPALAISVPSNSKALPRNPTACSPGLLRRYSGWNHTSPLTRHSASILLKTKRWSSGMPLVDFR